MKYLKILLIGISVLFTSILTSQVAIKSNETNPHSSAILDIQSESKGFLYQG